MSQSVQDPYARPPEAIEEPPGGFAASLRRIGPGLVMAGAVVGSGELVATTVLGAENGYMLLWLILLSCAIKIVVQNELGRYAIATGETTLEAFDRVPGPRFRVSWVIWLWLVMVIAVMFAIGGMLGAIAEVMTMIVPAAPMDLWVWVVAALSVVLLTAGRYRMIERVSLALAIGFTALTASGALILFNRPDYFSWSDLINGLSFHLPEGGLSTAVTVFGGTGVGSGELVMYPYWCIEKGYARFTGARGAMPGWKGRANGWLKVMGIDILSSLLIYTFATVAFYLLGAGVLHNLGTVPVGSEMVRTLSHMYTETLGEWSRYLFLIGAVAVLYSTVFAVTAANSRLFADWFGMIGGYDRRDFGSRTKYIRIFVVWLLLFPVMTFFYLREPVVMVKVSGIAQALMLPVIGFSAVYLRYRKLPQELAPKGWLTLALWGTSGVMLVVAAYSILRTLAG